MKPSGCVFQLIRGIRPTWGMTPCRMPLQDTRATTRSNLTPWRPRPPFATEKAPNMTIDTSTLPRRALADRDDLATPTRRESPLGTDPRRAAARHPRTKRGGHLLRPLLPDDSRQPASDPLLLLGPNGGPLWASRTH